MGTCEKDDLVYDVHDPVRRDNIRRDDLGVVHVHASIALDDRNLEPMESPHDLRGLQVAGHDAAKDHVVFENAPQILLVLRFQEIIEIRRRECIKRGIRRREDGERANTTKRAGQVGSRDRCDERGQVGHRNGKLHDVLRSVRCSREKDELVYMPACVRACICVHVCMRACICVHVCVRVCDGVRNYA